RNVVEVEGSKMYVNTRKLPAGYKRAVREYIIFHDWEETTTELFKDVIKEGDIVLDCGGNMGYFTLLAARLVGEKGRVYTFEPAPMNYSLVVKNIELNGYKNVIPQQKAVSNTTGTVKLFICDDDIGNNTIYQYGEDRAIVEVEAVALDEFFDGKEQRIDVIKMDIEGAEMAALLGMDRIIRENPNLKIFAEFFPSLMKAMGYSPDSFIRRLINDYHFSIYPLDLPGRSISQPGINSAEEFMELSKKREVVNLFLERS
ncbi:FkbM family methyltransferase, partial [Chloroflexota bacterium]